jgi:formylglycine-generating enzyme required for sulfatase activity
MRTLRLFVAMAALLMIGLMAQIRDKQVFSVDSRQAFERRAKIAVLAGVGQYPSSSGLSRLHYPSRDVDRLAAEFANQGYKVVTLEDQETTCGSIEEALSDTGELVDKGSGTLVFVFSGHGFSDDGLNYLATFEVTARNLAGSGLSIVAGEATLKATAGTFQMGCSPGDSECSEDEKPPRRTTISDGFWLDQTDVTGVAYRRVIGNTPNEFQEAQIPAYAVTWGEASNYCKEIRSRLPTEAEWE